MLYCYSFYCIVILFILLGGFFFMSSLYFGYFISLKMLGIVFLHFSHFLLHFCCRFSIVSCCCHSCYCFLLPCLLLSNAFSVAFFIAIPRLFYVFFDCFLRQLYAFLSALLPFLCLSVTISAHLPECFYSYNFTKYFYSPVLAAMVLF